jgi:chromosome segregation ATPase
MNKTTKEPKTTVADFVKSIDAKLNAREEELESRENVLKAMQDTIKKQREELSASIEAFEKQKADFAVASADVQAKMDKIRNDEQLTQALKEQANERKEIEKMLAENTEAVASAEQKLKEVADRERKLSEREKELKEKLEKDLLKNFFKG